jgi:hypothetical protein
MADWAAEFSLVQLKLAEWQSTPAVPSWARLEPLTLTGGDLAPGAQALLADPLWLLGRQGQFDELHGEDAGSPVTATVEGETAPLSRFRPGDEGDAVDLAPPGTPGALPLEAWVEAGEPAVLPLRLRTQLGLQLVRRLRAAGVAADRVALLARAFRPLDDPAPAGGDAPLDDPRGDARRRLASGRVPDSAALLSALDDLDDGAGGLRELPDTLDGAGDAGELARLLVSWRDWARGFLATPGVPSWDPHRLEHRFAAAAGLSDGPVVLSVQEYTGGALDWFHADLAEVPALGAAARPPDPVPVRDTTLPMPVRFAGMPADRLFAFEDGAVYLGGVEAGRTDLARMAVVEFALAYGVDWFQVPLVLPYGSVTRLDRVVVRDTFGVEVDVRPAREAARPGWAAFQATPITDASRLADVFVLAPTVPRVQQGEPLEEVALFRDELANLVWAVERVVPGSSSGEPVARATQAARVSTGQSVPDDVGDARLLYRLMTPVPENWIPLVAVPAGSAGTHELERRPMLRYLADGSAEVVHPRGTILLSRPSADPRTDRLRVAQEEVPREGVVVTRAPRLARTEGGGTVLWIGHRARVGGGEGSSGLRFDLADPLA